MGVKVRAQWPNGYRHFNNIIFSGRPALARAGNKNMIYDGIMLLELGEGGLEKETHTERERGENMEEHRSQLPRRAVSYRQDRCSLRVEVTAFEAPAFLQVNVWWQSLQN